MTGDATSSLSDSLITPCLFILPVQHLLMAEQGRRRHPDSHEKGASIAWQCNTLTLVANKIKLCASNMRILVERG